MGDPLDLNPQTLDPDSVLVFTTDSGKKFEVYFKRNREDGKESLSIRKVAETSIKILPVVSNLIEIE